MVPRCPWCPDLPYLYVKIYLTSTDVIVQQICDENQTKGSVSDKSTKISRKVAEMILFEISYGPKLNKSKMAAKLKKKSQNYNVIIKK